MKYILIGLAHLLFVGYTYAQTCDIQVVSKGFSSQELFVSQKVNYAFDIFNEAKDNGCAYAANSVMVLVSLPGNGLQYNTMVSPVSGNGKYFTWNFLKEQNVLMGINHKEIRNGEGEENITFSVKGLKLPTDKVGRTLVVSIVQNPSGPIFKANNASNDNVVDRIIVRNVNPNLITELKSELTVCGSVDISWESTHNPDIASYELQRSVMGDDSFKPIASTQTTSLQSLNTYTDNTDLIAGTEYAYKLYAIMNNGTRISQREFSVKNTCKEGELTMELFPNPVYDKLNVLLSGESNIKDFELIISNVTGEIEFLKESVRLGQQDEINVHALPAGVYNIVVLDQDKKIVKRFIKVK